MDYNSEFLFLDTAKEHETNIFSLIVCDDLEMSIDAVFSVSQCA